MKFTILIVNYNPVWSKLIVTLESILRQSFKDYEIVVSDDGSKDNCFDKLKAYFEERGFTNYRLVSHEKNQGTVKNLIDGLKHSQGKYVRDFGPGDAFYKENTLQNVYDFLEENQYEACFGLMKGYCVSEQGNISFVDFLHPFDIEAYRKNDRERIAKNLILYRDNASGACTCYTRDYYLEYLEKIEGTVIYAEDIFQLMSGLDGREMRLFPDYLVWYEADTGVSTKKKSSFSKRLEQDVDRFYEMLHREYADNSYVKRQMKVHKFYKISNLYVRSLLRMFVNPDSVRYILNHRKQCKNGAYHPVHSEKGFLDTQEFQTLVQSGE